MSNDGNYAGENYDQVVYYVAPAVLVAAILFCCFRMGLVYYMQIRPRRNQQSASVQVSARSTELQTAASGAYPGVCREIFLRVPPPNYDETIKNDRRTRSTNDVEQATISIRIIEEVRPPPPTEVTSIETPTQIDQPPTPNTRSTALRRAQSNIETTPPTPNALSAPPAYSHARRVSVETIDSVLLNLQTRDLRLPSYEEAVSAAPSRRPTLDV